VANLPFEDLSDEDQQYVRDVLTERGEEDTIPQVARAHSNHFGSGSGGTGGDATDFERGFPGGLQGGPSGGFPGGLHGGMPDAGMPGGMPGGFPEAPSFPNGRQGLGGAPGSIPGNLGIGGYPGASGGSPSPGIPGGPGFPTGASPDDERSGTSSGFPSPPNGVNSRFPGIGFSGMSRSGISSGIPGGMTGTAMERRRLGGTDGFPGVPGVNGPGAGLPDIGGPTPGGPGANGPGSGPAPLGGDAPFQFQEIGTCTNCRREFTAEESRGKTHCPSCGIAWENQGGTAGTVDLSAPNSTGTVVKVHGVNFARLIRAGIGVVTLLGGGGSIYAFRRRKRS